MSFAGIPGTTLMRRKAVEARVGLSRSGIYSRLSDGTFPKPIKLGPRAVAWLETEIEAWMRERIEESRAK